MTKEFIPYEQALALKSLGFDEPCFGWYDSECQETLNYDHTHNSCGWLLGNHCTAPTYSQAFRFFREKHGLFISFARFRNSVLIDMPDTFSKVYEIWIQDENEDESIWVGGFDTYEEAELATLNKLIQIIKNK